MLPFLFRIIFNNTYNNIKFFNFFAAKETTLFENNKSFTQVIILASIGRLYGNQ